MAKDRPTDDLDDLRGQPSPRTTIVGGRPPEGAPSRFPVPTGIQKLLHLAAASPEFLGLLLRGRAKAAHAAGVGLTRSEEAVLGAISDGQLATMAGAVPPSSLGPSSRQVAAAAVVLLGGAGVAACDFPADNSERVTRSEMTTDGGAAPHEPPARDTAMSPPPAGIAPDIPELDEPAVEPVPDEPQPTRGIRPDIPPERVDERPMEASGGAAPDEPPTTEALEPTPAPEPPAEEPAEEQAD